MYNLAREYYIIHKDLFIVGKYMTDKGVNLGYWISTQRELYKKNKLSEERIKKLEEIGMIWNIYDMRWENVYKLAKEFFDKNHNLLIPQNYVVNNINLRNWIMYQRELYNKKRIIKERIKKLEEIGMIWDPSNFITITSRNQRRIKLKLLEDMKELLQDYDNISSKDTINEINKKMLLSSR